MRLLNLVQELIMSTEDAMDGIGTFEYVTRSTIKIIMRCALEIL